MGRKLLKTVQTITTFRNPLADPMGTRRGPPLVRGPQFENRCMAYAHTNAACSAVIGPTNAVSSIPTSTSICNDLRPISLLPTIAKLFESIIGKWFLSFIEPHLDNCQFDCRKSGSTKHALIASSVSTFKNLKATMPQGSLLGPRPLYWLPSPQIC